MHLQVILVFTRIDGRDDGRLGEGKREGRIEPMIEFQCMAFKRVYYGSSLIMFGYGKWNYSMDQRSC